MNDSKPGLLVVTHGAFAEELVLAAKTIVGEDYRLAAVSIGWNDDVDTCVERLRREIGQLDTGAGVLVMTDMFGGTPTNLALTLHVPGRVEIVTGVNLPMLIKFVNVDPRLNLAEVAKQVADQGRAAIQVASNLLQSAEAEG